MRDFRDAKAMAQTLRESLHTKAISISHGESLELVSKMFGVADWNTLSAMLHADRSDLRTSPARVTKETAQSTMTSYPAVPLRDLVPFPAATYPLFVGRPKTMQALDQAFERRREVVLVVQKDSGIDEPSFEDIHPIGVIAQLIELEPLPDGTLKVLTQVNRRVLIHRFVGETGAFQADVTDLGEGPIPDAPELILRAVKRFERYAAARDIRIPGVWPQLEQTRDPGRVADIIATRMRLPIADKQGLLATIDPVARLKQVDAFMDFGRPVTPELEATKRRALGSATERRHQYATLEHLLLALLDDSDASAVMQACNADLGALRTSLAVYVERGLNNVGTQNGEEAKPTAAFQRAEQRAEVHAQEIGRAVVTGANMLVGIFPETRSPAAQLLGEHGITRARATEIIARGGKDG
ncbi:LON peptidase substrate-binding domain-containing protein [Bradyrhizobium manausense]|uniref:LON peptidase substrate-binding domain-containing protein n=1 Tax=Bradyrhizobium TaxID=374 RepID=UPI001BA775C8|nr:MULTISPECIES: LON peptidase substrate-binding domain-containing protein [Bradyrhizobium]MBR0825745.1 LON peptidase substrate-binding domain-containing protein [Bradyrhizobium manausense]UVO31309.1 LON peptidase substrate-binding domain-containing protein [Bradyrhizobium arachidis]